MPAETEAVAQVSDLKLESFTKTASMVTLVTAMSTVSTSVFAPPVPVLPLSLVVMVKVSTPT